MEQKVFNGNPDRVSCVVLCAGEGSRFLKNRAPGSEPVAKAMVSVRGTPLLGHVVRYWKRFATDFIFVVKFQKQTIIDYVKTLDIKARFVEQTQLRGIAHALSLTRKMVSRRFIMVLGDCLVNGEFDFPGDLENGVGVWPTNNPEDIHRSYSVEVEKSQIVRVVEKPKVLPNNLCGMGFYFFGREVFDHADETPPSKLRGEVEITDTLQVMIDSGAPLLPVHFNGSYLNVTYREDIPRAEAMLSD